MRRRVLVLALLCAVASAVAFAGTTGKIAGKVTDAKTHEPLVGVNVIVAGTTFGASTNIDGQYFILNLPPASYNLKISLLGYNPVTVNGIQVSIDLTTQQDFQLTETVIEQKEVIITAERPVIQKDLTSKTAIVNKEEIAALPVTEVSQVLSLQAGFVAGNLRGGRKGEVAYWIDGVPVTDAYDGSQVVEVNKNLVQEMQLVSGAFNAEYGQAMSGIVNIATREGGSKFNGSLSTYIGQYATSSDQRFVYDKSGALIDSAELYPGIGSRSFPAIRNIEANISGPLIGDKLTFVADGRWIYFDGWEMGKRVFMPWSNWITRTGLGDGSYTPMNWSSRNYGQGKLTYKITPMVKLNANYIYDYTRSKPYSQYYYLNPDGQGLDYNRSHTLLTQLTHTLSASTYYTLGVSYFNRNFRHFLYDLQYRQATPADTAAHLVSSLDEMIQVGGLLPNGDGPYVYSGMNSDLGNQGRPNFAWGGNDLSRFKRTTQTGVLKFDISSQVNQTNLVKVGAEYRRHTLDFDNVTLAPVLSENNSSTPFNPFIRTRIPSDSSINHDVYTRSPKEFSAYLQDKLEFKDFILNIGVRYDYFQPDGYVLNDAHPDPTDPLHYQYTVDDPSIYSPTRTEHFNDDFATRMTYWYKKASTKSKISPRIGASFPITAGGVVHFSYGHFFQIPQFNLLYQNPNYKFDKIANNSLMGNADLDPEQTVSGEIGIQQQLTEDVSFDLTAYMRDIRGLTGTKAVSLFGNTGTYFQYINVDFGQVKGIVLTVNKRFGGGFTSTLDYTFQIAQGTASDPTQARAALIGGNLPEVQLVALNWDQRHTLNVTASYDAKSWGASLIGQYGSGTPYTPLLSTDITALLTNNQLKPAFFNLDGRAFYELDFNSMKLVAFARVFNLLNLRNEVNVYNTTGRAGFTTEEDNLRNSGAVGRFNTIDQYYYRPDYFSEPRRIEIGMNLEF